MNLPEELVEDPHQRLVILRSEHLGDKPASFAKKFGGKLEAVQGEYGLLVGIVDPVLANIGSSIVQDL